jgi:membrane-bound lytic murein transglycosylase B
LAPSIADSSIFQPCGTKAPKIIPGVIEVDHIAAARGPNVARVRRTLAVLATLVTLAGPVAAQEAAPAPTAETVTGLADKVSVAARALEALEQRRTALADELHQRDAAISAVQERLSALQRTSSEAVAAAQQQALASYMRSDAAEQSRALMNAIAQHDVNDVAWSLGLLRITHEHSLDVVKAASTAKGDADSELTTALAQRAAVAAEAEQLGPAIAQAQADLTAAQAELATTVTRVGATVADGMTTVAYDAYRRAADQVGAEQPACGLRWELLSAIGKTESNHGGGRLDAKGDSVVPIIGIPIGPDTDGGTLDLDPTRDHAVGPMQFIPGTWRSSGADGNGDGTADPNNVFDETLAAGRYLCRAAGALTLSTRDGVIRAILSYNPNMEYLRVVGARYEALASDVAHGWFSTGDLALPAAPLPAADNADGGHPPSDAAFTPPGTDTRTLSVFGDSGLMTPTNGDVVPATCAAPSAVLAGRAGFVQCAPDAPAAVLDPCVVSPTDPTLVACISDPQRPVRLVRATTPQPATPPAPGPPFLALVLSGGDLCLPVAPPGAPAPPTPASTTTTIESGPTAPPTSSTSASTTTASTTSTTVASTTTTAPAGPAPAYRCDSGASVLTQPNTATAAWTVPIVQAGAPNRTVTVTVAWS